MSEKLCLQWNDFQENIKNVFKNLRESNDFTDVTLARLGICQKIYTTQFSGKRILHTENA